RAGNPFLRDQSIDHYCALPHLVVSQSGDPTGFIDNLLSEQGRERRVSLTVPTFIFALTVVASTDLLCAFPRRFAATHAVRLGVVWTDAPFVLPTFQLTAIAPEVALLDGGLSWLFSQLSGREIQNWIQGSRNPVVRPSHSAQRRRPRAGP